MTENWPNFFIVGTPRAGTTSLYNYLNDIPDIFMSPVKEPGYFIPNDFRKYSQQKYLELFKDVKNHKAVGEASAGYLVNQIVPKLIHEKIPEAKIIMSLRDPVFRTFSDYQNMIRIGITKTSFKNALKKYLNPKDKEDILDEMIKTSFYFDSVKRYLDVFGERKIKILIFERTVKDPVETIKEVLKFLNVDVVIPENITEKYNAYSEPLGKVGNTIIKNKVMNTVAKKLLSKRKRESVLRSMLNKKGNKPILSTDQKISLIKVFQKDIENLEQLLGFSLPWSKI